MKRIRQTPRRQLESLEPRRLLTTYTVDLGTLGGATSSASDINASGQVVGTSVRADGDERAFIWQNGVMTDLGTLGGDYSRALAMNDVGQVVGQSASSTHNGRAFLVTPEDTDGNGAPDRWFRDSNSDGKNDLMRDLGTLGGNYVEATAFDVNNLGQVAGYSATTYPNVSSHHAFRWQSGVMTDLGTLGGQGSYAHTINDAGQIGGWFWTGGNPHAFLWENGVGTDLGFSYGNGVTDINGTGQWVADSRVWTPTAPNGSSGTFATLGQLPPAWPYPEVAIQLSPQSINSAGQVVGYQTDTFGGESSVGIANRGVRWINGVPEELPLEFASAINDTGQIVGSRGERAFLLANENFPMPLLAISGATVTEGHSGMTNAVFTVSLSKAAAQTVTFHYATADGTATAGDDYLATAGTLTFTPGQTSKTISVTVLGDRIADYGDYQTFSEAFTVALSNPSNALVAGTPASGVIQDDEPRIFGAAATILEGNVGSKTALVTVNLSSAYDQPVTVSYGTNDGTAEAGSDYVATSGTETFAPGQTTRQIAVSILGDHVVDHDTEYVYVFLTNPSANASVIGHGGVTIQDDEPHVTISPYVEVTEPATGTIDALLTVGLSAAYDQDVIVEYATSDAYDNYPSAVVGSDYVETVGSVRIPAGQTSRTFTVPVIGDGVDEAYESFYAYLSGVSDNAIIGDDGYGGLSTVGIRDDDGTVRTWIGPASGGNWSTAGNWSPSGVPAASNHVSISGKSVNLSASATLASLTLTGGASLAIASNGSRVLRTSALAMSSDATLNVNDNDLIVDYSSTTPLGPLQALVKSARAGGAWNGFGITSTSARESPNHSTTLGVMEASDYKAILNNPNATFAGELIDSTAVLVKYTYYGDANFSGTVNFDDYVRTDVGFNTGRTGWSNGDFNGDGVVNFDDYVLIDIAFNTQDSPLSRTPPSMKRS